MNPLHAYFQVINDSEHPLIPLFYCVGLITRSSVKRLLHGTKTITSIINDNNANFSKKSDQKLQFLFDSFLPVSVIVCPVQESFDATSSNEAHTIK